MNLIETDVRKLKGVGDAKAKQLLRLGVSTVHDLITYFPVRFEDRSKISKIAELGHGSTACVNAVIVSPITEHVVRKGMVYYKATVRDDSAMMTCIFFNNKYIKTILKAGHEYTFYGKVNINGGRREMVSPEFELSGDSNSTKAIIPVYPLTSGITQKYLRGLIKQALDLTLPYLSDILPAGIVTRYSLASYGYAIKNIHFPEDSRSLELSRKRLVFEELYLLQLTLRKMKQGNKISEGLKFNDTDISSLISILPFSLTSAQKKVVDEILADLSGGSMMNRLVQGDVGSGKTIVAAAALYCCAKNGFQAAMMVPTEVLARQHYNDLSPLLTKLGINCELLTGSLTASQKRSIYTGLENGDIQVVFGTHALITDKVNFASLALAITDEQHRFGVRQRMKLSEKGKNPHTLVMTATPIPRTHALIIYGDMDISVIDELPPGRQSIDTFCVGESMRQRVYSFIRRETDAGNRCYIICPAIAEAEGANIKSAEDFFTELKKIFPDIPIGIVHGKMKSSDKEAYMNDFIEGRTKILVATTAIEVGVNVPEATLMIIENAERFGLSQLHQLRGRVGRGKTKSYCILFCGSFSEEIKERMAIITKTGNGFEIAEKDLSLRGPGDFFGTRQHGVLNLKIANLANDINVLKESGEAAAKLLSDDPLLENEENFYISRATNELSKNLVL